MKTKRVIFEIEVDSDSDLNAAKLVEEWLRDRETNYQYYVQDVETNKVVSVDLSECDSNAVVDVDIVIPNF